jgi:hypothetical protein
MVMESRCGQFSDNQQCISDSRSEDQKETSDFTPYNVHLEDNPN